MSPNKDNTPFELQTFFPYQVRLFYRAVSHAVREVYATQFDLSVNEWRTLVVLNDHEPLSAGEIVIRSSMDKVNVSRAVASLQQRNYLKRHIDPTDRRRVLLRLTPRGRKILSAVIPMVCEMESSILNGLSGEEQETLLQLMSKVRLNAEAAVQSWAVEHDRERKLA